VRRLRTVDAAQPRQAYQRDARTLGELGRVLVRAPLPKVQVRLPKPLAEQAVAAWEWDDDGGSVDSETCEQRVVRSRAAALALIGLSITEGGRWEADEVVVDLDPNLIGMAINAADDLP
jgi:hypothetical protein